MQYHQLYYTSSQHNFQSHTDGFGVRSYTEDFPLFLVEEIKDNNLFFYQSGNKAMVGTADLMETPKLILEFPKSYAYFESTTVQGKSYFVLLRNVFIGRDYGFYLEDQDVQARTGNTFVHILVFEDYLPESAFDLLEEENFFKPANYLNKTDNTEMVRLLTGEMGHLPMGTFKEEPLTPFTTDEALQKSILLLINGLEKNKKLILRESHDKSEQLLNRLLSIFPFFLKRSLSFASNFQGFNLETQFAITLTNEYYNEEINPQFYDAFFGDHIEGNYTDTNTNHFLTHLLGILKKKDFAALRHMNEHMDKIMERYTPDVRFDILLHTYIFFYNRAITDYDFDIVEVLPTLREYKLKPSFVKTAKEFILNQFKTTIRQKDTMMMADYIALMGQFDMIKDLEESVKSSFSDVFFSQGFAQELFVSRPQFDLVYAILPKQKIKQYFESFIQQYSTTEHPFSASLITHFFKNHSDLQVPIMEQLIRVGKTSDEFCETTLAILGEKGSIDFLEKNDFFTHIGSSQMRFLSRSTQAIIKNVPSAQRLAYMKKISARTPAFANYIPYLMEISIEDGELFYDAYWDIMAYYTKSFEAINLSLIPQKSVELFFENLLKKYSAFNSEKDSHYADYAQQCLEDIVAVTRNKRYNEFAQNIINFYNEHLAFMHGIWANKQHFKEWSKTPIPSNKYAEAYILFIIENITVNDWTKFDYVNRYMLHFGTKFGRNPIQKGEHLFTFLHQEITKRLENNKEGFALFQEHFMKILWMYYDPKNYAMPKNIVHEKIMREHVEMVHKKDNKNLVAIKKKYKKDLPDMVSFIKRETSIIKRVKGFASSIWNKFG